MALGQSVMVISKLSCTSFCGNLTSFCLLLRVMQRTTPVALSLYLVLLSQICFQARASPTPHNLQPLKDSPAGCLTVIFFLVLSLTILFVLKKIYVARRRKMDPVSIFSDEFLAPSFNQNGGKSMTKVIAKKSGFYVGLLGSPGWETTHSVFIGGGPRHISLPPESHTPSYLCLPFGSSTTTKLYKVPAKCEITSTRPAPSNVLGGKPQLLNILSPEISRPPLAMISPKHSSLCFDTKSLLPTRRLSSPPITQHSDFQSNENITFNSGPRKLVLVSGPNLLQSRIDVSRVSIYPDFKDVRCFSIPKRRARTNIENFQQINSDDANDSILETAAQDFSVVSPPKASHKILDPPKSCLQSVDLSSSSVRLKPQCSTPTRRTKNSPIIGPSPLRTMSLPSDYDPSLESSSPTHSSPIPKRAKTVLQADDSDIILDLIRELARETSAWDASLFVDENFKALMDQSSTHPNYKLKVQIAPEKRSKYRLRQRRTTLQDIPESDGTECNFIRPQITLSWSFI